MGPRLKKKKLLNEGTCGSCKQYMGPTGKKRFHWETRFPNGGLVSLLLLQMQQ